MESDSKSNSFSMAKSIVSAFLVKAISEGHIKSLDQPFRIFYPNSKAPMRKLLPWVIYRVCLPD